MGATEKLDNFLVSLTDTERLILKDKLNCKDDEPMGLIESYDGEMLLGKTEDGTIEDFQKAITLEFPEFLIDEITVRDIIIPKKQLETDTWHFFNDEVAEIHQCYVASLKEVSE